MLNWYRFKQPVTQAQEANTLCYASLLRQIYYFYRPDILGLLGGFNQPLLPSSTNRGMAV